MGTHFLTKDLTFNSLLLKLFNKMYTMLLCCAQLFSVSSVLFKMIYLIKFILSLFTCIIMCYYYVLIRALWIRDQQWSRNHCNDMLWATRVNGHPKNFLNLIDYLDCPCASRFRWKYRQVLINEVWKLVWWALIKRL